MVKLATHEWSPGADATAGASAPLAVLVHGVTGWWRTWWRLGPALADAGWRVVAVDQRGHGDSPRLGGPVTVRDLADDLAEVIEAIGRPVDLLIGHSLGGAVAAELAVDSVELVDRLVLEDPPAISRVGDESWLANMERELEMAIHDPEGEVRGTIERNRSWLAEDARQDVEGKQLADRTGLVASFRADIGIRVLDLLPRLTVPTLLVLADERRSVFPPVARRELAEKRPAAVRQVVVESGHTIHRDLFDEYLALILNWAGRTVLPRIGFDVMERLTLRDVPGIRVGHWTDAAAMTGCTVVLAPDAGAVAGVDVRGSAPGTRETDLLRPTALVDRINAICLAGGSAFGLAAADGVMRRLGERGIGYPTGVRPVPIVPAAILFDLAVGDPLAFPDADAGYAATLAAESSEGEIEGRIGAGTGATVAKLGGVEGASPGGIGSAARRLSDGSTVGALVVNNALGAIHARDGRALVTPGRGPLPPPAVNTTLVVLATDAPLDRAQCRKVAELGHDALAIGIRPSHTMFDGDVVFTLATGDGSRVGADDLFAIGGAAIDAIGEAIERSVAG